MWFLMFVDLGTEFSHMSCCLVILIRQKIVKLDFIRSSREPFKFRSQLHDQCPKTKRMTAKMFNCWSITFYTGLFWRRTGLPYSSFKLSLEAKEFPFWFAHPPSQTIISLKEMKYFVSIVSLFFCPSPTFNPKKRRDSTTSAHCHKSSRKSADSNAQTGMSGTWMGTFFLWKKIYIISCLSNTAA